MKERYSTDTQLKTNHCDFTCVHVMAITAIKEANITISAIIPSRVFKKETTPGFDFANDLLRTFRCSSHLRSELHIRVIHSSSKIHSQKTAAIMYAPIF